MSPTIRGKRVSSMRMPTLNPYWLKPPRTRPVVMRPNFTLRHKERRVTPPLRLSLHVAIVLGLVVLASLFFGPRIYVDQTLLIGDGSYYVDPSFRAILPPGTYVTRPRNFLTHIDNALNGYPRLHYVQTTFSAGEIPWWNPYLAMGLPGVGTGSATFEPVTLLLARAVSVPMVSNLKVVLSTVIAGYGMFLLVTTLGASRAAAVFAAAVLAAYVAVRVGSVQVPARARAGRVALVAAAVVVGVAIALVQLLPMAELIARAEVPPGGRSSARAATGIVSAAWYSLTGDWTTIRRDLPTAVMMIAPLFFGTAADASFWWRGYNMMEMMVYAGVLPLLFAAYAAARRRQTPGALVWLGIALGSLGAAYALPLFNVVNYLPVLGLANNGRLRLAFRFALIVAAALGFDRFLADLGERRPGRLRFVLGFAAVAALVPALAYPAIARWGPARPPAISLMLWRELGVAVGLAALAALVALVARGALRPQALVVGVVALAVLDPWWHLGDFNPPLPTAHVFPETPAVRFLKSDPSLFRVSSGAVVRVLTADTKLPYRLYDVDIFGVLSLRRHTRLQQAINGRAFGRYETIRAFLFRDPATHRGLMSLMNIKYVLMPPPAALAIPDPYATLPWYRPVYDRDIRIYENLDTLPRAFLVNRARVVAEDEALATIVARDFDPRAGVLLEDPRAPALSAAPGPSPGTAEVTSLSANRVVVRAAAARPAYLVLSEANYPGWRARDRLHVHAGLLHRGRGGEPGRACGGGRLLRRRGPAAPDDAVRDDVVIQERYGERSEEYFWNTASDDVVMAVLTPALRAMTTARRPLRVLDVGCGPGNTLRRLQPWGQTFGAEYSEVGLSVARRRGLTRLVAADSLRLPFSAEAMDCVLALDVIEHVKDDIAALREAHRLLRPGGVLVLTVPAFMSLWRSHDELYGHYRRYSKAALLAAVRAAGFETERCEFTKCLFYFPLLVRARLDRARKGDAPGGDDFFDIPSWLNTMLRWQIVWEHRLRIGRILPVGVTLVWMGRR